MGRLDEAGLADVLRILEDELALDAWWYLPADELHLATSAPDELIQGLSVLHRLRWALWSGGALHEILVHGSELPRMVQGGHRLVVDYAPDDLFEAAPLVRSTREILKLPAVIWPQKPSEEGDQLDRRLALLITQPLFDQAAELIHELRGRGHTAAADVALRVWTLVAGQLSPDLECLPTAWRATSSLRR